MDELTKKKRVRGGHRASASRLVAKIVDAIANATLESPEQDVVWLKQSEIALKDKIKVLKEFNEQIIDILSSLKDEAVDEQVLKEIEDSDEAIVELERTLIQLDGVLRKPRGQSPSLFTATHPISAEENLNQSHVSLTSVCKTVIAKLLKLRLRNFSGKICE